MYPFGYGLSFTSFAYTSLALSSHSPAACASVSVSASVTNTGVHDGDEVVQLYVRAPRQSTYPVPILTLQGILQFLMNDLFPLFVQDSLAST